jgi:hypothetical protein
MRERTLYNAWLLLLVASLCFLATLAVGFLAGVITAAPIPMSSMPTLRGLQPVHTALALAWIFFGSAALVAIFAADDSRPALWASRAQLGLALLFLAGVLASAARGVYSGREYVTWPPVLSLPIGAFFLLTLAAVRRAWPRLVAHSREAAWLLLLGASLLPAGLAEAHLYLLPSIAEDPGRDLAVQWHALDTMIAGWNILLYGIGLLLLPPLRAPLRGPVLFLIAATGILFDFGHHNYPSPQPHVLKIVSFSATMLAFVSFARHLGKIRRTEPAGGTETGFILRHVEGWTLFAVGSGILLAVPWVNRYLHGTYAIAGHTMGCVIGVNSLLILAAGFAWSGVPARDRRTVLRWNSGLLALFCGVLILLGLAKGLLRIDDDFLVWNARLQPWYALFPLTGLALAATLAWLGGDLARCCRRTLRGLTPDRLVTAGLAEVEPARPAAAPAAPAALRAGAPAPPAAAAASDSSAPS